MAVEVTMPSLGEDTAEADVLDWLVAEGDEIQQGEVLVELETDKSTVEFESPVTGVVQKICVAAGSQGVAVGTLLALIEPSGDAAAADRNDDSGASGGANEVPSPATAQPAPANPPAAAPQAQPSAPARAPSASAAAEPTDSERTASGAPVEVKMPVLGEEATEADVLSWLVEEGAEIAEGEVLVELETDKSTVEYESPVTGVLREIRVPGGTQGVAVGTVLALIEPAPGAAPRPQPATEVAPRADFVRPPEPATHPPAGPTPTATSPATTTAPPPPATPVAKRMAADAGLSLGQITGSGVGGKVVKNDVESALAKRAPADASPAAAAGPAQTQPQPRATTPTGTATETAPRTAPQTPNQTPNQTANQPATGQAELPEGVEAVPLTRMRRTIARRLSESKQTVPHFYLRSDCRIDAMLALRKELNASGEVKLSVNDFVVRAVALALVEVPNANVTWGEEVLHRYRHVGVSVAVATEGGLVTPVVQQAERKGLATLSREIRDLATRARDGKLNPREYQGGTVTVSNLGMYGIDSVYPIINPPQSAIFGIGQGSPRAVVVDGALAVGTVMTCTLAADHRAIDGAIGAELLAAFQRRIEDPLEMLL